MNADAVRRASSSTRICPAAYIASFPAATWASPLWTAAENVCSLASLEESSPFAAI